MKAAAARIALFATFATGTHAADTAPPARYILDPAKSTLEYQFTQAGALNKGRFNRFAVTLDFSPDALSAARLDVVVETSSLDTGDRERDETLKGPDLFSIAKFPQSRFTSTQITRTANGYDAAGKLTLRGVTRDIHIPFTFRTTEEEGRTVGYLLGKTVLKRLDYAVGQGDWKSTEWVGNDVWVSYSLRLSPPAH